MWGRSRHSKVRCGGSCQSESGLHYRPVLVSWRSPGSSLLPKEALVTVRKGLEIWVGQCVWWLTSLAVILWVLWRRGGPCAHMLLISITCDSVDLPVRKWWASTNWPNSYYSFQRKKSGLKFLFTVCPLIRARIPGAWLVSALCLYLVSSWHIESTEYVIVE